MNNIKLKRIASQMLFGFGAVLLPCSANAAEGTVTSPKINDECSQEILLSYFPGVFVSETLKKFNVPQDQWDAIKKELLARDKEIIKQVEAKASKMNPNPLKDPEQRQAAVKLFRETLFDNFGAVAKAHGIKDDKQIQAMLDDIQQQKAKRFAHCMEVQRGGQAKPSLNATIKQGANAPAATGSAPSDEEDDDDDDDDEDEG